MFRVLVRRLETPREAAGAARIRIRACRSSGLSVRAWCRQEEINATIWYAERFRGQYSKLLIPTKALRFHNRKLQTSPRIKGRHLKASCCSLGWRSIIFAVYSILPGHLREAAFQPMLHPFCSVAACFAGAKADSGMEPSRSPSPFQSSCRSRCWSVRRPAYWQTASSSCPSQRASCCARHGCCSAPDGHPQARTYL